MSPIRFTPHDITCYFIFILSFKILANSSLLIMLLNQQHCLKPTHLYIVPQVSGSALLMGHSHLEETLPISIEMCHLRMV